MNDYDLPDLETWLSHFQNFEKSPSAAMLGLERMRTMAAHFGHPELACPSIHVAGSKGKGTIATSTAAILTAAGQKVGLYTSPHILHLTERIHLGAAAFPPDLYHQAFLELKHGVEELLATGQLQASKLTWYELVTMLAMLTFRHAKVDWAIYEVGMGGRLDATNIIQPTAIGMGLIELEHTEYLGDTIAKIAREKAGVFKPGVPIFSVPQSNAARTEFATKARQNHAKITYVTEKNLNYIAADQWVARHLAKTAIRGLSDTAITTALKTVSLPGRYEKLILKDHPGLPFILLDGAHTEASIAAVLARLKQEHTHGTLLFACAADKRVEPMAEKILASNLFSNIFLTKPGLTKPADLPRLEAAFAPALKTQPATLIPDHQAAIRSALAATSQAHTPLIVLGSFYLVGEVKKLLAAARP